MALPKRVHFTAESLILTAALEGDLALLKQCTREVMVVKPTYPRTGVVASSSGPFQNFNVAHVNGPGDESLPYQHVHH